MDFKTAKALFREEYVKAGLILINETEQELYLQPPSRVETVKIGEKEIVEFAEFMEVKSHLTIAPASCSVCSLNFREHVLNHPESAHLRRPSIFNEPVIFGKPSNEDIYVEISDASTEFINFFRFRDPYLALTIEKLISGYLDDKPQNLVDVIYRPLTIKVLNLGKSQFDEAIAVSSSLIEACLFELSYMQRVTVVLAGDWPPRRFRKKQPDFGQDNPTNQLPLPKFRVNSDTVRIYQRGAGTGDPVVQFLSYYQVLEYHFLSVSDEQLYAKLTRRLTDPKFTLTPNNLDRVIHDTTSHKRETDEVEMLKLVLSKFIDETDVIEFIRSYETYLREPLYTKKRVVFGDEIEVKIQSGHVMANIAKRIKIWRNALVHSSDRWERNERFVPTSKAEAELNKEIPLIRFLAEKVILGSGQL